MSIVEEILKVVPDMVITRSQDDFKTPYTCLEMRKDNFTVVICKGREFSEVQELRRKQINTKILFEK